MTWAILVDYFTMVSTFFMKLGFMIKFPQLNPVEFSLNKENLIQKKDLIIIFIKLYYKLTNINNPINITCLVFYIPGNYPGIVPGHDPSSHVFRDLL